MSSWNGSTNSFVYSLKSGADFFGPGTANTIAIVLDGDVALTSSGTKIAIASASLSGDVSVSAVGLRMVLAESAVDGDVGTTTVGKRLPFMSVSLDGASATVAATAMKDTFAASAVSGDADVSVSAMKDAFAASALSSESDASITAIEILLGASDMSGSLVSVVVGREILLAESSIEIAKTFFTINEILRFSPEIVEDVTVLRPLLSIDNVPLSEHGREFNSAVIQSFIENRNWDSKRSRYYKASSGRKTFSIQWSMLPSLRDQTVDKRIGRDRVRQIATDPDVHTLKILNLDSDGATPYTQTEYNVLVRSYKEDLVRRDINNDMYLWDCTLELEEV